MLNRDSLADQDSKQMVVLKLEERIEQLFEAERRESLAADVIGPFLARQRWFRGKARQMAATEIVDLAPIDTTSLIAVVRVRYEQGTDENYAMPLAIAVSEAARRVADEAPWAVLARVRGPHSEGVLYDAVATPRLPLAIFDAMAEERSLPLLQSGELRPMAVGTGILHADLGSEAVRPLTAEQSNTSVVIGDRFILKFFRRIEPGINPDFEIGRFLSERTEFRNAPAVVGAMTHDNGSDDSAAVAILQRFVSNDGDGWSFALRLLDDYFAAIEATPSRGDEIPRFVAGLEWLKTARTPHSLCRSVVTALDAMRILGERTGQFHLAMVCEPDHDAFAPQPMDGSYLGELADGCTALARESLELLSTARGSLSPQMQALADEVLSVRTALTGRFESLRSLSTNAQRIRCHGDYHLGQVLRLHDDFCLIDFEGEPIRSIVERRKTVCPLKDLAGMLRSLSYATQTGLQAAAGDDPERLERLQAWATVWQTWCSEAFMSAYLKTTNGAAFIPEAESFGPLLDAFVLEKAFYELSYELNNRPDWAHIPLRGIACIVAQSGDDAASH